MSRNDGYLYSGASSSTSIRAAQKKEQSEARKLQRQEIQPVANELLDLVAEFKADNVQRLVKIISPDFPENQDRGVILGVQFSGEWLDAFEKRVFKILRPSQSEVEAQKKADKQAEKEFSGE
jgi:hypothetical protein